MSGTSGGPGRTVTPQVVIGILAFIFVIVLAATSFYTVDQREQGVVLRFGRFVRLTEPGLHFKLPFGIERRYNVPTQAVLKEEFGFRTARADVATVYDERDYGDESTMLTGDLNIVDVEWIIQYRISDPVAWLFQVENQRKTIRDISQSVINLLVGDRAILDVIGAERATIEQSGLDMMNSLFDKYRLGIRVTTVKLQNIVPPVGSVQSAFEDVNKAIQDRSRLINEGKQAYNETIPRAKGEAEQLVQQAEGYKVRRVNQARGDVARFDAVLAEYRRNPAVTRARLYYEMFEDVFAEEEGTDLIDKNLQNFIPFKSLSGEQGAPGPAGRQTQGGGNQ
ncbi:MAG: FtsH protease activity modulator HflK [Spirochaetota bacterium]